MPKFIVVVTSICLSIFSFNAKAQQASLKLVDKESKVLIHGTSSVHDWSAQCDQRTGDAVVVFDKGAVKTIQSLNLRIKSKSIRSIDEKGAYYDDLMDSRIWKALETDKFADITVGLKQIKLVKPVGPKAEIDAIAIVTIRGVKKELPVKVIAEANGTAVSVKGKKSIKMSEFGVKPPTILLEFLTTGDEITIEFELSYK